MKIFNHCSSRRIRRLNRRQRKKSHLGEFQELGFSLCWAFQFLPNSSLEEKFIDDFMTTIELHGLACGGSLSPDSADLFISRLGRGTITEDERASVINWLESKSFITQVNAGSLVDVWYHWD